MINLCNILLPKDRTQTIPANNGRTIKPTPVTDSVIDVEVVAMITILSTHSNIVFRILYFLYFFLDLLILSLKDVINFLMLLTWLSKLFTSLIFFSNLCSKSIFSNGAVGYILSHFCSIYL